DRRSELVSNIARARAALTRWTGELAPEIAGPMPEFSVDGTELRAGLERLPAIKMMDAQSGQADADLRVADAGRRSDFGVNLAYQRRDPRFGDYVSAGVTVSLPFFTRNRQNAGIAAAQKNAGRVLAEREAALRALAADLDADLADHIMHHEQWMRTRDTLLPLAAQRVTLETASYGAGRASLVDIADAYAALADATLNTLDREALVAADAAMSHFTIPCVGLFGAAALLAIAAGGVGFTVAKWRGGPSDSATAKPQERKILYWYDPMIPAEHHDGPGLSSMGMQTIPRYADEAGGSAAQPGISIDPSASQALGLRTVAVRRGDLASSLTATGTVDFNLRDVAIVQARAGGFVNRVYARAPGDVIGAGAPLADVLVPEWGGAQAEFLAVRRTGNTALIRAARQRLMLLGMPAGTIA
ncbi:hypothetical protein KXW36_008352, partial [Aspergillus fumigatus]